MQRLEAEPAPKGGVTYCRLGEELKLLDPERASLEEFLGADLALKLQSQRGPTVTMNPRFTRSIEAACRAAAACALVVMLPSMLSDVQAELASCMPVAIATVIFTASTDLATTLRHTCHCLLGMSLALLNAIALRATLLPEGARLAATVDFSAFTAVVLLLAPRGRTQASALAWSAYLVTAAAAALEVAPGPPPPDIVPLVLAQLVGSTASLAAVLLPVPATALGRARQLDARAAETIAEALLHVAQYYVGVRASALINLWNTRLLGQGRDVDAMRLALDAAWWEGFDLMGRGALRAALHGHWRLLRRLGRSLRVLQLCALREEFSEAHNKAVEPIRSEFLEFVGAMTELLVATAVSVAGDAGDSERVVMRKRIAEVSELEAKLAAQWHATRSRLVASGVGHDGGLSMENLFIYKTSSCADLILDCARSALGKWDSCETPPKDAATQLDFNMSFLQDPSHLNFVARNTLSATLAFALGIFFHDLDCSIPGFVGIMLSDSLSVTWTRNLCGILGAVVGTIIGNVMFVTLHDCDHWAAKSVAVLVFEWMAMFLHFYTADFSSIGIPLALCGGYILVRDCAGRLAGAEQLHLQVEAYHHLHSLTLASTIIIAVNLMFLRKPASSMSSDALLQGMAKTFFQFKRFLREGDQALIELNRIDSDVENHLDVAELMAEEVYLEPRWHKASFRSKLVGQLCELTRRIHLELMTLQHVCLGGAGEGLFDVIAKTPSFPIFRGSILTWMDAAQKLVRAVLEHESVEVMDAETLRAVDNRADISALQQLEDFATELLENVAANKGFGTNRVPSSMALDPECRASLLIEMLRRTLKDVTAVSARTVEII